MLVFPPAGGFIGPVKRSVTIAGHATSISLEPIFWQTLEAAAALRALPLNALIAQIDALRIVAEDPPNLASALRSWILADFLSSNSDNHSQQDLTMRVTRNSHSP
ncbi:ribbon-helix-helix domain-containing protein [Sphingomonas sp. PAMC 26605]|uniref:ribbon-helix-helix domain-containing protein n=1 Tax=Sphingomonas sp. PAMC 26605 TaxID=1112214 RepID=UPI00026CAB9B|nr:ribbon-helix-helix domain-containing protein [Sphingomonas sp. PAMC 26605]